MASTTTPDRRPPDPDGEIAGAGRPELVASARRAGGAAVTSGRWLADTVLDVAPRLPVRGRSGWINRRATPDVGYRVARDLGLHP